MHDISHSGWGGDFLRLRAVKTSACLGRWQANLCAQKHLTATAMGLEMEIPSRLTHECSNLRHTICFFGCVTAQAFFCHWVSLILWDKGKWEYVPPPENCYARYGFASFSRTSISTVGLDGARASFWRFSFLALWVVVAIFQALWDLGFLRRNST